MLIILTNGYPYDGEPFLQSEAPYLPDDAVFFAVSVSSSKKNDDETRDSYIIGNGAATASSYLYAAAGLFDKSIYHEIKILKRNKKLSIKSIRRLFSMYVSARNNYRKIVAILEKQYSDRLHEGLIIYSYWMDVHAVISAKLKRRYKNAKIVTRCHGYDLYEYRHEPEYIPFRQLVFDAVDLIVPISQNGKDYLINTYGKNFSEKIRVSRLGTKECGTNPNDKSDKYTIVSCSSITKVKRIDKIVKAISFMNIPVRWIHFGDGDQRLSVKSLAKELLDEKNGVEYHFMGKMNKDSIFKYYADNHIDIFINTSDSEGIPVSIMEAMSFGIPVVATDVGGTGEIVKTDINGKLLHVDENPESIAMVLQRFAAMDDDMIEGYRKEAKQTWAENYCEKKNFGEFIKMIEDLKTDKWNL